MKSLSLFLSTLILVPAFSAQAPQGGPAPASEQRWKAEHEAGLKAIEEGRYSQAVLSFRAAIGEKGKLGVSGQVLAQSINGMAQAYLLQGNYTAAERHFQQSLGIFESAAGPDDPNVAIVLNSLATVHRLRENYNEATPPARRSLAILEKVYGAGHPNVAIGLNNLALILRLQGAYDEARLLSERSLAILEKALGPEHPNVGIGLNNLVLVYRLQGNYLEAESLARRSLAIFEREPGPATSNLLQSLENLAGICRELHKYDESERLYRRVLSSRWGAGADVVPVLESFAAILNAGYSDTHLKQAREAFQNAAGWAGVGLELYILMGQTLQARGLTADAEDVLRRAVRAFPRSLKARYELAEAYAKSHKWRTAFDTFNDATKMEGSGDPAVERHWRSMIYEGIARMNVLLIQFDEALSNFRTAMELDPGNAQTHVALGDLYLQLDEQDEAAEEYAKAVLLSGGNAAAYYGIAEVNRRLGRFPQSVMAADRALAISRDPKSSYIRAVALFQDGRREDGEAELEQFRRLEADERDKANKARAIRVALQSALARMENGQSEEAIQGLRDGIRSYPDSASLHLNLGMMQSSLGKHRDALKTFQAMIDLGFGNNFLVHLNLSREYELLGDTHGSQQHRLNFLEKYDAALKAELR